MPGSAVADLRYTYGAAFIGLILSTVFYGVTIAQTWTYYCRYRGRDPITLKGFIIILFILDTLHTVLCVYSVYWYLILNFGNVVNLGINMWAINIQTPVNCLIGYMVQLFYARRVYLMSKNIVIPVIITVLGGLYFALGIYYTEKEFELKYFSRDGSLTWVTSVGMSSTAIADVLIALAMCWCLYHKRTGFSRTDSMILTLMSYSVSSGLLTSIFAIGMLVCYATMPTKLVRALFFWLMGKCYVNSLLTVLNNRDAIRERPSKNDASSSFHLTSMPQRKTSHKKGSPAVTVNMHQSTSVFADFTTGKDDHNILPKLDKSEGTTMYDHEELPESTV